MRPENKTRPLWARLVIGRRSGAARGWMHPCFHSLESLRYVSVDGPPQGLFPTKATSHIQPITVR
jgi:hypothetical protein